MAFTVVGWTQSVHPTTYTQITALSDSSITVSGNFVKVPQISTGRSTYITGAYGLSEVATSGGGDLIRYRFEAPSVLNNTGNYLQMENVDNNATSAPSPNNFVDLMMAPVGLEVNENLAASIITGGVTSHQNDVFAFLGDASNKQMDLAGQRVISVRATGTTTLTAHTWSNFALTFDQALAAGTYGVIGARFLSAGAVMGRLVVPGYAWRPGAVGSPTSATGGGTGVETNGAPGLAFRYGARGFWAQFNNQTPPSVDLFSESADTAEDVILDLVRV